MASNLLDWMKKPLIGFTFKGKNLLIMYVCVYVDMLIFI